METEGVSQGSGVSEWSDEDSREDSSSGEQGNGRTSESRHEVRSELPQWGGLNKVAEKIESKKKDSSGNPHR